MTYYRETAGLVPLRKPGEKAPPLPAGCSCPLAVTYQMPVWQREVLLAWRLLRETKGGITWREVLGREPTARDIAALNVLSLSQSDAMESDRRIHEKQAAERAKKK